MLTFLLLILNPFVLDFFGLARGYGISLGCQMASLYYVLQFFNQHQNPRYLLSALIWAGMGVLANFSLLNYFVSILGIIGLYVFFSAKQSRGRNIIYGLLITGILTAIIWEHIRKLKTNGHLWYGGNSGFYDDTLVSLAKYTAYSQQATEGINFSLNIFIAVFFLVVLFSIGNGVKKDHLRNISFLILVLCVLSIVLQHYLLGNLYIIDRTALFLFPLIMLTFGLSGDVKPKSLFSFILTLFVLGALLVNTLVHANLYKTATWFFDAHTEEILDRINAEGKARNKKLIVDYSGLIDSGAWYYLNQKKYEFVDRLDGQTAEIGKSFDYYIFINKPVDKTGYNPNQQAIVNKIKDTVIVFEEEGIYLFKNVR